MTAQRQKELEKSNLRAGFMDELQVSERQQDQMHDETMALAHKRTNKVLKDQQDLARGSTMNHKSDMNLVVTKARGDRNNLMSSHAEHLEYIREQSDKRVDKLSKDRHKTEGNLAEYYSESVDQLKDGYRNKVMEQRDANIERMNETNQAMAKRFKAIERGFEQKMDFITSTYDAKFEQMQDGHKKELKRIEGMYQQRMTDRDKGFKTEKESLEQKYENKISLLQEQNDQKIDAINKRHNEDMKTVVQKTNYSRKA